MLALKALPIRSCRNQCHNGIIGVYVGEGREGSFAFPLEEGRTYAEALVHRLGMVSCVRVESPGLLVPQKEPRRSHRSPSEEHGVEVDNWQRRIEL